MKDYIATNNRNSGYNTYKNVYIENNKNKFKFKRLSEKERCIFI